MTRPLPAEEIERTTRATGAVLIEALAGAVRAEVPCGLVRGHAPFCWGESPAAAVSTPSPSRRWPAGGSHRPRRSGGAPAPDAVRDKHFERKHGAEAYYGQS